MPLLFLMLLAASPSSAPSASERFKGLYTQAESLYRQGDFGAAIWNFIEADRIRETPEVAYDLAKSYENLNDTAFANYYYRLYLARAPKASDALEVAERIGAVLVAAQSEGRGGIEVEASGASRATIAGLSFPSLPLAVFLPPGEYELAAQFPSGQVKRLVQVRTGKITSVALDPFSPPLVAAQADVVTPPWAPPGVEQRAGERRASRTGLRAASYVALGAALVAGAIAAPLFGAMSSSDAQRLRNERATLPVGQAIALANSANTKGACANALWIAAPVAALAGGAMFVFSIPEPGAKTGTRP